ncbi:MAG: sigma 54-interacting transcriptional regulator [Myxococcota bacterium]|jgi:transcriptional regulator with GAF, ATPase, and Fis domain|nr:sigma 54-interacting transcriptional regulator [Myxococcota bacterium]
MSAFSLHERSESAPHRAKLERLCELYQSYRLEQRAQVVVVNAPLGSWAESLLNDFKRHVLSRREPYFESAFESAGGRTYGPIRELLGQYVHHLDELGLSDDGLMLEFAELSSQMGVGNYAFSMQERVDPRTPLLQLQFYERIGRLLQLCSQRTPAVLVIRDAHLADSTSRAALRFLVENHALDPVDQYAIADLDRPRFRGFLVLSSQDQESGLSFSPQTLGFELLDLAGVDEQAVRSFLQDPSVVQRFLSSSRGDISSLRSLLEALPAQVDDLFERRLLRLGQPARSLLSFLAVYEKPASPDFLARLAELPSSALGSTLRVLLDAHLIEQRVRHGQLLLSFVSPHEQKLLLQSLDSALRQELHRAIANLLDEQRRVGQAFDVEEIAHHFLLARDGRAYAYALEAAEKLHIGFAFQRAAEFLEQLCACVDDDSALVDVYERLIELYTAMNHHRRALKYAGKLKRILPPQRQHGLQRRIARTLLDMGRFELAQTLLERNLDARSEHEPEQEIALHSLLAEALYGAGERARAAQVCQRGHTLIRSDSDAGSIRELVSMANTLAKIAIAERDFPAARGLLESNIERATLHAWADERVRALFNIGIVELMQHRHREAEQIFQECLGFGHNVSNPVTRAFCFLNLGVLFHQTLRWNQALEHYLHSLATFKSSANDFQFVATALNTAELYLDMGDLEHARSLVDATGSILEHREIHHYRAWRMQLLGRLEMEQGRVLAAAERFDTAIAEAKHKQWHKLPEIIADRVRAAILLGELERAEGLLDAMGATQDTELAWAQGLWLRALLARERRQLDRSCEYLQQAIAWYLERDFKHPLWELLHDLALLHFALGQERRAHEELDRARLLFAEVSAAVPESLRARFAEKTSSRLFLASLDAVSTGRNPHSPQLCAPTTQPVTDTAWSNAFIGNDERLIEVLHRVQLIAESESSVLILGESGTGKELLAEAVHQASHRAQMPLVKVNCGAFVETLLLSELFGHEKGAFTGALNRKQGRFELADGGTLFLDEIGDISPNTQVALLRVLQEGTYERVGGTQTLHANVRLVCATNRKLEQLVKSGQFRLDLYYRLKGVVLEIPPLRDRIGDIPMLAKHFLAQASHEPKHLSRSAMSQLLRYTWPGNVRELQNFLKSLALLVPEPHITAEHIERLGDFFGDGELRPNSAELESILDATYAQSLTAWAKVQQERPRSLPRRSDEHQQARPDSLPPTEKTAPDSTQSIVEHVLGGGLGLSEMKRKLEFDCIQQALTQTGGNVTQAAALLQMKRPRLSQIINADPQLQEIQTNLAEQAKCPIDKKLAKMASEQPKTKTVCEAGDIETERSKLEVAELTSKRDTLRGGLS